MSRFMLFAKLLVLISVVNIQAQTRYNHHTISVDFNIEESSISVVDTIVLADEGMRSFVLNKNLHIYESSCEYVEKELDGQTWKNYELQNPPSQKYLVLKYKGIIDNNKEEFADRSQMMAKGTSGLIFDGGIYLSGASYWVPRFHSAELKTFTIRAKIDKKWNLVSQGTVQAWHEDGEKKCMVFNMEAPTNQVYLVGNKWTQYTSKVNNVDLNVFLINADEKLAQRYLGATSQYLNMYENLFGTYPYTKFDVVENFWETGFGMPSFTLLGQKVIRFPWILGTSYPHELLHNYWGNSVYVDYETGNWCEGITTYMADHLLKEKGGAGAEFRRSMLKKYTDYASPENDFPVTDFKTKLDEVSEAVGYSKVVMINHMLRVKYGSDKFLEAYTDFYNGNKFKTASFTDIQNSFEKVTGDELNAWFGQWINKTGAPLIKIENVKLTSKNKKYVLNFDLSQSVAETAFMLDIPVCIYYEGDNNIECKLVSLTENQQTFSFKSDKKPLRISIDPNFDVMRTLSSDEVPPSLSQVFGSKEWAIVLPTKSKFYANYKGLAQMWLKMYARRGKKIEIVDDSELQTIPANKAVWVFGNSNAFARAVSVENRYKKVVGGDVLTKLNQLKTNECVVYTVANPNNKKETVAFMNASNAGAIQQIPMKLMHYGNYSYLGFGGEKLSNTLKGNFPVINSSLNYIIDKDKIVDWGKYKIADEDRMYEEF